MAEEETPPSSDDDKPFFAIDAEDVAEATAAAATATTASTAPSAAATPQPMMLGTLGNPAPAPVPISGASPATSVAEGEVKANPWGAPTSQLTGDINTMTGQGMFAAPMPVPEAKAGFRWGQFFIGLVAPLVILLVAAVATAALEPDYDDFWRYESVELSGQNGTVFEHQASPSSGEFTQNIYAEFSDEGEYYRISCYVDYYAYIEGTSEESLVIQLSPETYSEAQIGSFFPSNQTLWFSLSDASADSLQIEIEYVKETLYEDSMHFSDVVFCLLPLAIIAGTVVAFVRGNRALGFGMLTSIGLMIFLPFLFVFLVILAFSGI